MPHDVRLFALLPAAGTAACSASPGAPNAVALRYTSGGGQAPQ